MSGCSCESVTWAIQQLEAVWPFMIYIAQLVPEVSEFDPKLHRERKIWMSRMSFA